MTDYLEQAKVAVDAAEENEMVDEKTAIFNTSLGTTCALIAIAKEFRRFNDRVELKIEREEHSAEREGLAAMRRKYPGMGY